MSDESLSSNQRVATVYRTGILVSPDGLQSEEREWVDADEYRFLRRRYDESVNHQQELNGTHERDVDQLHAEIERLTRERDEAEKLVESLQNRWASRDLTIERLRAALEGVRRKLATTRGNILRSELIEDCDRSLEASPADQQAIPCDSPQESRVEAVPQYSCFVPGCPGKHPSKYMLCEAAPLDETPNLGPREPDNSMVICPHCTCQFTAISVDDQTERRLLRDYADHKRGCATRREFYKGQPMECDCGFSELERAAFETKKAAPCLHAWTIIGMPHDPEPDQACDNGCGLLWKDRFGKAEQRS